MHLADSPGQVSQHATLAGVRVRRPHAGARRAPGALERQPGKPDWSAWLSDLQATVAEGVTRDAALLESEADPIHPARIYGELVPRLADDAVVIGDGGDFVSFAGKFVEPKKPGGWLDPGPYGCLGAGLGSAIAARLARPSSQVVLLLGDGAAGMSLMDVDTLVRHDLPVVMVCGNNSAWGLEKQPMQMLYGYDVVADLAPQTRYDQVVTALGGGGETVTDPTQIGPALDRAFAAGTPYLVNVITDVERGLPAQHVRRLAPMTITIRPAHTSELAEIGELTVEAYAEFMVPDDGYAHHLRDAVTRAREAELYVALTDDGLVGHRDVLPAGLAVVRARAARRGRVPDARRAPLRTWPGRCPGAGVAGASSAHASSATTRSCCPPCLTWPARTGSTSGWAFGGCPSATGPPRDGVDLIAFWLSLDDALEAGRGIARGRRRPE